MRSASAGAPQPCLVLCVDFHQELTRDFRRELTRLSGMFRFGISGQGPAFLLCGFGVVRRAVLEAEAVISGFENVAMMGEPIEQRRGHLGIAEDAGPFAEAEVRRDNDAGSLIKLAQQMEEQRTA